MATTWWLDPFLHNSSSYWGNGTTTDTNSDGSYSKPFSYRDLLGFVAPTDLTIKIKGKSKSDLFVNLGKFYSNNTLFYSQDAVPATGNTNWAANRGSTSYNSTKFLFMIDLTESGVPDVSPQQKNSDMPFLFGYNYYSSGTGSLEVRYSNFHGFWQATRYAGYNSASNPFPADFWGLKSGYTHDTGWPNGDFYYHFKGDNNNVIKVEAGFVNETETTPSGYSIYLMSQSDSNEYQNITGSVNTEFDCERLVIVNGNRAYWQFNPQKNNYHHKLGGFVSYTYGGNYARITDMASGDEKTVQVNFMSDKGYIYTHDKCEAKIFTMLAQPSLRFQGTTTTESDIGKISIGSVYQMYSKNSALHFYFQNSVSVTQTGRLEILNGSTLYSDTTSGQALALGSSATSSSANMANFAFVFPTTFYKSGISGGWMASASSGLAPSAPGGSLISGYQYARDIDLYKANWYEQTNFTDNVLQYDTIPIATFGVLKCNGTNPKGATNSIFSNGYAYTPSQGRWPRLLCFETNDYDNTPITLIPTNTAGSSCMYAYNRTLNSSTVLTFQGSGNQSGTYIYPMELAVPSFTAGTDNIRIKLVLSRENYTQTTQQVYVYYRKPDSSSPTNVYNASQVINSPSISTDTANPSTHYKTIVPSSTGVREINSIWFAMRLYNTGTTHKLNLHSVEVETY